MVKTPLSLDDTAEKESIFRGYIRTENKRSLQKFGKGEKLLSWDEADQYPEFAGVLSGQATVVDCDLKEHAACMLRIVRAQELNCIVTQTPRGLHFIFAAGGGTVKNLTHRLCALGLEVDIRCGTNAYIVLKQHGNRREVLRMLEESRPMDKVPRWLLPLQGTFPPFLGMREGDGRNSTLYAHVARLTANGFTKVEACQTIRLINQYVFAEPLDESELSTILRDEAFDSLAHRSPQQSSDADALTLCETLHNLHPENNPRYQWTDIGAGRLFADIFQRKARYVPERKVWYCYDGKRWVADIGNLKAMEFCKMLADALMVYALKIEDERARNAYLDYCRKWQLRRNRETILRDAQSVHPISMKAFDSDPYALNCSNGTLHLGTMAFKPHCPDNLLTKITETVYDANAQCDRWECFIDEIMDGDPSKVQFLRKAMGYALSGDTKYECMFLLYGASTRNGKGTLCESVLRVMGAYGCTTRYESIGIKAHRNSAGPSEDIARLAGIRFVNIAEPAKGLTLDAAQIKALTGGDSVNARFLHENSFDFRPQFKVYVNSNHLPAVNDMTLFASGRIHVIPFTRHFDEAQQDRGLKHAFASPECQSAILNWMIEGYRLLEQEGLLPPATVQAATNAYSHENDKIRVFAEEMLVPVKHGEVRTAETYAAYRIWCGENGYHVESNRNFKQMISTLVPIERRRPKYGGGMTTMIPGYQLTSPDGIAPL